MRSLPRSIFELFKALIVACTLLYAFFEISFAFDESRSPSVYSYIILAIFLVGLLLKTNLKWNIILFGRRISDWSHKYVLLLFSFAILLSLLNAGAIYYNFNEDKKIPPVPKVCTQAEIEQASESVVIVTGKWASGSAFWINEDTLLTNNHVVDHNPDLKIDKTTSVRVVATDSLRDIALIRVGSISPAPPPLTFTDIEPNLADEVYVIGYPLGKNLSVTKGIISAFPKDDWDDRRYIQTDAPISGGNSGGPLVDRCGKVVGMNTQVLYGAQSVGYAIAWDQLTERVSTMLAAARGSNQQEFEQTYPSDQAEVVAKYYTTLSRGDLEGAYNFFSAARKARLPFANWKVGLEKTYYIRLVSVKLGNRQNVINAHFYAAEFTDDGWDYKVGEFEGTWTLVRENGLLKMDESNIKDITKPVATPTAE